METFAVPVAAARWAACSPSSRPRTCSSRPRWLSPFGASTVQLGIGAALLLALSALAGSLGVLGQLGDAEPWQLAGGLASALYITAGILLFPRLGALVAVGLFIAGQMVASLVLDGFGWLGVTRESLGGFELAGAVAVTAGSALIVRAQARAGELDPPDPPPRRLGGARPPRGRRAAGPGSGQRAAQRRGSTPRTTVGAVSFLVATAAMLLAHPRRPRRRSAPPARRAAAPRAVVGLARRLVRRDLRDHGVPAHPGDRRRPGGHAHGRRPAAGVRGRRPLRAAAPPAPGDPGAPARRRRGAPHGRGRDHARLTAQAWVRKTGQAISVCHCEESGVSARPRR